MSELCEATKVLVSNEGAMLNCEREEDHPGLHYDAIDKVWWDHGAPDLEVVELRVKQGEREHVPFLRHGLHPNLTKPICGKVNPRTGWVCGLPVGHASAGDYTGDRHLTIINGERFDWREEAG